jgi:hypothetical protein
MNQVANKKEGALATVNFEADANQGAQNISQEDLALPFLKVLGQLSPEVNKRDAKYCVSHGQHTTNSFDFYERHTTKSEQKVELNDDGYQNAG